MELQRKRKRLSKSLSRGSVLGRMLDWCNQGLLKQVLITGDVGIILC